MSQNSVNKRGLSRSRSREETGVSLAPTIVLEPGHPVSCLDGSSP
jgi:hypothetical protein